MAGPYEMKAYFAEKEKGEATRREIAQQFMEYRRLNPEATAEDMRQFLSMSSGGSPYVPHQLQGRQYIDRIAEQNGQTKAKRLLEEEHKKVLLQAQESGVMEKAFGEALDLTGGDIDAATRAVGARFGNDPYMMDIFKQRVDPKGVANKWKTGKFEASREVIASGVANGMSLEEINATVDPALANHDFTKALIKQRDDKKARDEEERQYTLSQRQAAQDKDDLAEETRLRGIATDIVAKDMTPEMAATAYRPEDIAKIKPYVQEQRAKAAELSYQRSLAGIQEKAKAAAQAQVNSLNLKALTGKGGKLEGAPHVAQAAQFIANGFALTSPQLLRLQKAVWGGVSGKTYAEAYENLFKAVTTDPAGGRPQVPVGMTEFMQTKSKDQYDRTKPGNFQQVVASKNAENQATLKMATEKLAAAMADPRPDKRQEALKELRDVISDGPAVMQHEYMSLRSTLWGETSNFDERLARQSADSFSQQYEQLLARIDAQLAKDAAPRVAPKPASKPVIAPRAAAPRTQDLVGRLAGSVGRGVAPIGDGLSAAAARSNNTIDKINSMTDRLNQGVDWVNDLID